MAGVVGRFGGLPLVGIDDDEIDPVGRHPHLLRPHRTGRRDALDLRDDEAAVVARRQGDVQGAEIAALVLHRDVAVLVRRGAADDRHVGRDVREMQPLLAAEFDQADDVVLGCGVHLAAMAARIDEGVEPDLGQHAGALSGGVADHVEQNAARHVIGGQVVGADHLPDLGRFPVRRTARVRSRDDPAHQARLGQPVDPVDPVHVARRDGQEQVQIAGMPGGVEGFADGFQGEIGRSEAARRTDRDGSAVGDALHGFLGRDDSGRHGGKSPLFFVSLIKCLPRLDSPQKGFDGGTGAN